MDKASDLHRFLATYGRSFARAAYLLTGDPDRARTLTIEALTAVGRHWSSVRWNEPAYAVLRELYRRYLSVSLPSPQTLKAYALGPLPPKARAALVSRFHDGLSPQQASLVTGLWGAVLDQEIRQGRDHLYATHPELFPTEPPPSPPPQSAQTALKESDTPWAAPSPEVAPSQFEPPATSWWGPRQMWGSLAESEDPALHSALSTVAAGMPDSLTDVVEPVLRRITRRRRIRVATWSTAFVGTVSAFVALITLALNSVATNVENALSAPTASFSFMPPPDDVPDPLPATLRDPIKYAYRGFCRGGVQGDPANPQPCDQWRLTTVGGNEWRLEGARAGWDEHIGASTPLVISPDGHRLAYRAVSGAYVVRDLPTGTVKTISVPDKLAHPAITVSPNGRYFSMGYSNHSGATLDFEKDITLYDDAKGIQILAVSNNGTRVVQEKQDAKNVRGHPSVTKLFMNGPGGLVGGYRIDTALTEYGGALAPDGHTLALVTADLKLVTMDARTGRVGEWRTDVGDYDVVRVERWTSRDEVLVRFWDEEYVMFVKVNVRTGATEELDAELGQSMDDDSPLGALVR